MPRIVKESQPYQAALCHFYLMAFYQLPFADGCGKTHGKYGLASKDLLRHSQFGLIIFLAAAQSASKPTCLRPSATQN
jgi:hypothetical protein